MTEKHANPDNLTISGNVNGQKLVGNAHDDAEETIRGRIDHDRAHGNATGLERHAIANGEAA